MAAGAAAPFRPPKREREQSSLGLMEEFEEECTEAAA